MLYAFYGFICGLGIGLVMLKKCMSDCAKEIDSINKSWRIEVENKEEIIKSLRKQLERR